MTGATAAVIAVASIPEAASALSSRPATAAAAWNHNPASPIGPLHWGDIGYPICGMGMNQSPVNIRTRKVAAYHGSPLLLSYESSELGIENTGHYVEVPIPTGASSTLQINGDVYPLVQYHFHVPSEHAVNGRLADLEAHLVHTNAQGVTAVVGVFFNIGPRPNRLLDKILLTAPATAGQEITVGKASPAELFRHIGAVTASRRGPLQVDSFYSYDGSLTTPGCAEGVLWSVLASAGQVSYAAVARFHRLIAKFPGYNGYPNNNRPLQPLNGRVIRLRSSRKDHH